MIRSQSHSSIMIELDLNIVWLPVLLTLPNFSLVLENSNCDKKQRHVTAV